MVLMRIRKRAPPLLGPEYAGLYGDFVVYAFNRARPSLRESLSDIFTYTQFKRLSTDLGLKVQARPTDLNFEQWLRLFGFFATNVDGSRRQPMRGAQHQLWREQSHLRKRHRTSK